MLNVAISTTRKRKRYCMDRRAYKQPIRYLMRFPNMPVQWFPFMEAQLIQIISNMGDERKIHLFRGPVSFALQRFNIGIERQIVIINEPARHNCNAQKIPVKEPVLYLVMMRACMRIGIPNNECGHSPFARVNGDHWLIVGIIKTAGGRKRMTEIINIETPVPGSYYGIFLLRGV